MNETRIKVDFYTLKYLIGLQAARCDHQGAVMLHAQCFCLDFQGQGRTQDKYLLF